MSKRTPKEELKLWLENMAQETRDKIAAKVDDLARHEESMSALRLLDRG